MAAATVSIQRSRTTSPAGTMGSKITDKKRKAREPEPESDNELANGLFDGVLSQSEDEEDYVPSDEVDDSASESGSEGSDASEDENDDDDILSDDIPSDVDDEEEIDKLVRQQSELEITEPGVDPKRKEDDGEEKNYRVETDANGGERYVYECVFQRWHAVLWPEADLVPTVRSTPSTTRTTRTPRAPSTRLETFP